MMQDKPGKDYLIIALLLLIVVGLIVFMMWPPAG